ncbi:hypothetical protein LXL04_034313 [Taraxacum kok-saghyz]
MPGNAKKLNNPQDQTTLQFQKQDCGEGSSVITWKHDEVRIKNAMLNLFVVGELPIKFVENEAFIEYTNALNGKVHIPSRDTISRDVATFYLEERKKFLNFFANPNNTIHLTTDSWTSSCKKENYLVITGHFIDDNWGAFTVHTWYKAWGPNNESLINKVFTSQPGIALHKWVGDKKCHDHDIDNASSNDKALEFLSKKLANIYEGGKHFHIRCMAHILNLIVKDDLRYHNLHVENVQRDDVRYIRHSTGRIKKFKKCMKDCGLEGEKFLCGECPTRWNSTFQLLKSALVLQEVFFEYEVQDTSYTRDLKKVPEHTDFRVIKDIVVFLEKFKTITEIMSSSTKPLIHTFLREILDVEKHLTNCSTNIHICHMIPNMQKLNYYTCFAVLLDPCFKEMFLSHVFEKMLEKMVTEENHLSPSTIKLRVMSKTREVVKGMEDLFKTYEAKYANVASSQKVNEVVSGVVENDFLDEFLVGQVKTSVSIETELRRYLNDPRVAFVKDFDILDWWEKNGLRFPIVARMPKDILSIQMSIVASESAFSTSGRILDEYRTRLTTPIVEALVKSRKPIIDDDEDILKDDEIALGNNFKEATEAQYDKENGKKAQPKFNKPKIMKSG